MTSEERLAQLERAIEALRPVWHSLTEILSERAAALTESLISQDNEQTRGRIKQIRELMNLPETLQQERDGIRAGLADEAPAIS